MHVESIWTPPWIGNVQRRSVQLARQVLWVILGEGFRGGVLTRRTPERFAMSAIASVIALEKSANTREQTTGSEEIGKR